MVDTSLTPELDNSEIALLEARGTRRVVKAGEYLYRAGDSGYDFYIVLSGLIEIVLDVDGEERVIISHGPGRFLGELNLLTGLRVFVSARVAETAELLAVPVEEFRHIIATRAASERQDPRDFHGAAERADLGRRPGDPCHRFALFAGGPPVPRVPLAHPDSSRVAGPRRRRASGADGRTIQSRAVGLSRRRCLGQRLSPCDPGSGR